MKQTLVGFLFAIGLFACGQDGKFGTIIPSPPVGGDLSGNAATATVIAVQGQAFQAGSVLEGALFYYSGSQWIHLATGTNGQFLMTQGSSQPPAWATVTGVTGGFTSLTNVANAGNTTVGSDYNALVRGAPTTSSGVLVNFPASPNNFQAVTVKCLSCTGTNKITVSTVAGTVQIEQPLSLNTYADAGTLVQSGESVSWYWNNADSEWEIF